MRTHGHGGLSWTGSRMDAGAGTAPAAPGLGAPLHDLPARGVPVRGERAVATPWSFQLLLLFLLLLYSNAALLVPALAAVSPAQWVAVVALGVLFVERSMIRGGLRLAWPQSHLLLAFLGFTAISGFTALWPRYALENVVMLLKFLAIYFLVANTVETWKRLRVVTGTLVLGGLFPAVGALLFWAGGERVEGNRAGWIGIFANPNDLAYALTLLFPLAYALALERRGMARWLGRIALPAYAAAIFLTYSRSGLLAFGAVALVCLWRWSRPSLRLPALLLVGLLAGWAMVTHWSRDEGFEDLSADATVASRLQTIEIGLKVFADRPLLGAGLGCSLLAWPEYAPREVAESGWLHTHNTFIQLLSETGALGSLAFGLALAASLAAAHRLARRCRRRGRKDLYRAASAVETALWGFLICGLAGGYVLSWFPYLLLGLASAVERLPEPEPAAPGPVPGRVRAWPGLGPGGAWTGGA